MRKNMDPSIDTHSKPLTTLPVCKKQGGGASVYNQVAASLGREGSRHQAQGRGEGRG